MAGLGARLLITFVVASVLGSVTVKLQGHSAALHHCLGAKPVPVRRMCSFWAVGTGMTGVPGCQVPDWICSPGAPWVS